MALELEELKARCGVVFPPEFLEWLGGNCLVGFRDTIAFESDQFRGWFGSTILLRIPTEDDFPFSSDRSLVDLLENDRFGFHTKGELRFVPFAQGFDERPDLGLLPRDGYYCFDLEIPYQVYFLGAAERILLTGSWPEFLEKCEVRYDDDDYEGFFESGQFPEGEGQFVD